MKMKTQLAVGEEKPRRRTVVVGVKLDADDDAPTCKELLNWALFKVAQPGDLVIALHVLLLNNNVNDTKSSSSLLSLVKVYDSLLSVYEDFCNLKQVDLKLKICRCSPTETIPKVLVREAKSYYATHLILGIPKMKTNHSIIRTSVPKYCSKRLPKDTSVLAIHNGKIVFNKGPTSSTVSPSLITTEEFEHHRETTLSKNSKALNDAWGLALKQKCSICSSNLPILDHSVPQTEEDSSSTDDYRDNLNAVIIPVPEIKSGWPLLRQANLSNQQALASSSNLYDSDTNKDSEESSNLDENSTVTVSSPSYSENLSQELEGLHEKYSATCRLFKYEELLIATSNFSPGNLIGIGGSSEVYRGCLIDGNEIAVKILKPSENATKEFTLEIEIISMLHHKNVTSLIGFSYDRNELLLVYDYLEKGSLEENLNGNNNTMLFGWKERYNVALGIAEALYYLHDRGVIHRDVKSSNILLSNHFHPQLSDFGLAKWASTDSSRITCTDIAGTFGYLAPEYFMYGKVNEKIDVYAFGVVLLELLSGRKPISSNYPKGKESLVMWAKPILGNGNFSELLDPSLDKNYDSEELERMILVAALCIRRAPRARPQMSVVLKLLQGETETIKWGRLQVNTKLEFRGLKEWDRSVVDEEGADYLYSDLQSHLNIALQGVEGEGEDFMSISSSTIEQSFSVEEYLRGRWSGSSSVDQSG